MDLAWQSFGLLPAFSFAIFRRGISIKLIIQKSIGERYLVAGAVKAAPVFKWCGTKS